MSGMLIFAGSKEAVDRIGSERNAFRAHDASDLPEMLAILREGGLAVANMNTVSTGYRIPEGCDIDFDEDCPKDGPHRIQAEGRKLRLYPHQELMIHQFVGDMRDRRLRDSVPATVRFLKPGSAKDDKRILEQLQVKSPFQATSRTDHENSADTLER